MRRLAIAVAAMMLTTSAGAQQIYKCSNGKGGNTYQQIPCANAAATKGVRSFTRVPDAPRGYPQQPSSQLTSTSADPHRREASMPIAAPSREDDPSGYVRCTKPSGKTYLIQGTSCRIRREPIQQQAGMVRSLQTGQERYMVPGGGNGMIDPATGQRYELIGPQPMRRTQDTATPVSRGQVCAEARAALSDPNRTMDSIRTVEARVAQVCGG